MLVEISNSAVPIQYRRLAHRFRDRISEFSDIATPKLKALVQVAATDCRRGYAGQRPAAALANLERRWRDVAGPDRLDLSVRASASVLEIIDTRIVRSTITEIPGVADVVDEPALTLVLESIAIRLTNPRRCIWRSVPIATFSLHCLGRFFERSGKDDGALIEDINALARAYPHLIETSGEFTQLVKYGQWRGIVANLKEPDGTLTLALHVRTFV